ncbi:hypothetical protein B566_EDAN008444 [Ephemera danica]|nr:hypothetical protein B566_EDAN008444 [Ephemera danica]
MQIPSSASQRLQEATFMFHLTPQQATDISMSSNARPGTKGEHTVQAFLGMLIGISLMQVQLRFCLLETSCEQDDYFPPSVSVKVNSKVLQLPNPIPSNKQGVEPKRPPRPNNITPLLKLSPTVANHISVTWAPEYGRNYTISVYLVRKLSSSDLISRLKTRGVRQSDYTRGLTNSYHNESTSRKCSTLPGFQQTAVKSSCWRMARGQFSLPRRKPAPRTFPLWLVPVGWVMCAFLSCFILQQTPKVEPQVETLSDEPGKFSGAVILGSENPNIYPHELQITKFLGNRFLVHR